jgi:NET1-associated nuclear protein 1 (U3 small nucleolar RNA-associated protein 17)
LHYFLQSEQTHKPEDIVASSSGELLGITNKRKLHVWSIPTKGFKAEKIRKIKLHHTKSLTTLAFHHSERVVAGGDESGRILIWRGFGNVKFSGDGGAKSEADGGRDGVRGDDDAEVCTTLHWHSRRVTFLRFSSDGAYLFSGFCY